MGIKKRIRSVWQALIGKPTLVVHVHFGIDVTHCSDDARVCLDFKATGDPKDSAVTYLETRDGLRLIFRDGKYSGWYTPTLPDALN